MKLAGLAIFSTLVFFASANVVTRSSYEEDLHQRRLATFELMQISPGLDCTQFKDFLNNNVTPGGNFSLPFIGTFTGFDGIFEYYQLVLKQDFVNNCFNFYDFFH